MGSLDARRGHDVADFCDRIWANAASQHRAGQASPGAAKASPPFGDHRLLQETTREAGSANNAPASDQ
jgi:hypothetical protein